MRKAISAVLFLIAMSIPLWLSATAQEGDILFLNGKKYFIFTNPLAGYLEKNPGKLPEPNVVSTSNWRGYVASWIVKESRLLLIDVTILRRVDKAKAGSLETEDFSVMSVLFPGQKEVFADWFTGHVIIPDGKRVNYVHMGYASTYEKYIVLRVEAGALTRQWTPNATEFLKFRDSQFAAFKETEEYRKALAESTKGADPMSAAQAENFLRAYFSEKYTSKIFN